MWNGINSHGLHVPHDIPQEGPEDNVLTEALRNPLMMRALVPLGSSVVASLSRLGMKTVNNFLIQGG